MTGGYGCVKRRSAAAGRWPNLHEDLLRDVYARLECPLDRIRLAAACNSWRTFASTHPRRPVFPWLLLDPSGHDKRNRMRCYCPENGKVLPYGPLPLPGYFVGRSLVGCHDGGWVAWYDDELGIMNLFTGVKVDLSAKQRRKVRIQYTTEDTRKIIFSSPPTSNSCILAAITSTDDVAVCRLSHPEAGWSTRKYFKDRKLMDIAFYGGELYGLTRYSGRLTKININVNKRGTLVLKTVVWATIPNPYPEKRFDEYNRYIVALPGKLLMVTSDSWPSFTVFELVDEACSGMTNSTCKWVEATSLGDHALFLGATGSKAVHMVACGRGGVRRNHIYYFEHIVDSCSFYTEVEDVRGNVDGITSVWYHVYGDKPLVWLLRPDM